MNSGFHPLDSRDEIKNIPNNCIILKVRDKNIIDIYRKIYPVQTAISFEIPFDFLNKENDGKCFAIEGKNLGKMINIQDIEDSSFDNYISFDNINSKFIFINKIKNIKTLYNMSDLLSHKGVIIFTPDEI